MKKKLLVCFLSALVLSVTGAAFSGCANKDDKSWQVSSGVRASLSDNGKYGFVLTVEGNGEIPDYTSVKQAPWYKKSGRITDIVIKEGVTAVGDNAFTDCKAKTVVIPKTANSIGEKCFYKDTQICVYNDITPADGAATYLYSETKPKTEGTHWRYKGGVAAVWVTSKILFIGNSFTFYSDIPALFNEVATAAGECVEVESVTQGSWTLSKFADKNDAYGKIVDEKLNASNDYDVVVLQEQSTKPINDYNGFLSGAKSLQSKIKATQNDCEIYLYSTWGYKEEADAKKITIPEMEAQIRAAYEKAAGVMGVKVSYAGAAFSTVYETYPDLNLYFSDNKHPSYTGAFLSACVHASTILDCDVRLSTFTGELDKATADILKAVAYSTANL